MKDIHLGPNDGSIEHIQVQQARTRVRVDRPKHVSQYLYPPCWKPEVYERAKGKRGDAAKTIHKFSTPLSRCIAFSCVTPPRPCTGRRPPIAGCAPSPFTNNQTRSIDYLDKSGSSTFVLQPSNLFLDALLFSLRTYACVHNLLCRLHFPQSCYWVPDVPGVFSRIRRAGR